MCKRCDDLDRNIERCRRMIADIADDLTIRRLSEMLADLDRQLQTVECSDKK